MKNKDFHVEVENNGTGFTVTTKEETLQQIGDMIDELLRTDKYSHIDITLYPNND